VSDPAALRPPPLLQDRPAWLAAAIGGVLLTLAAAPGPSWLDSAELIAAAAELGGIHPPGHPAWLSIAGLAHLLPIGAYSARVVWLSALFGAGCVLLTVRLARRIMGPFAGTAAGGWWAFGAGLALACSGSLWLVGCRAEVYTLAGLTNLWALDAALRAGEASERDDLRGAGASAVETAIAVSLGLLNHHYVTVFTLPALFVAGSPALLRLVRERNRVLLAAVLAALFMGLGYLAPSLRALADTELRWGDPTTVAGFYKGVTAEHFHRSVTESNVSWLGNLAVLFGAMAHGMGQWVATLGLVGLGLGGMRRTRAWLAAALMFAGGLATKAPMAINTHNPDDYGYTLVAAAMLGVGVAAFGGFMFDRAGPLRNLAATRRRRLSVFVLPWLLLMSALNAVTLAADRDVMLRDVRAPDVIDSHMRGTFSPGALYLSNSPFVGFNEQAFRIAEGRRPDLTATHLSLRTGDTDGGRGYADWLARRRPALAGIGKAAVALGRTPVGNVMALAERWDVYAEHDADHRIPTSMYGFDGFANRLVRQRERGLDYDVSRIADRHRNTWDAVYAKLAAHGPIDRQTREVLVWQHAMEASHALRRGWRAVAKLELERARKLAPRDIRLARLAERHAALEDAVGNGDAAAFKRLWRSYSQMPFERLVAPAGGG